MGSLQDRGERIADEEARWEMDHNANYLLPREDSHGWLQLSGVYIAEVMAKLCGVDLRPQAFAPGAVAQTSAARINVIVINLGSVATPVFQILFDRASLDYFRGALMDAMGEFDGAVLGIDALI
ncbi:Sarcosine oxidase, gamma subunit family [compost metagenome]